MGRTEKKRPHSRFRSKKKGRYSFSSTESDESDDGHKQKNRKQGRKFHSSTSSDSSKWSTSSDERDASSKDEYKELKYKKEYYRKNRKCCYRASRSRSRSKERCYGRRYKKSASRERKYTSLKTSSLGEERIFENIKKKNAEFDHSEEKGDFRKVQTLAENEDPIDNCGSNFKVNKAQGKVLVPSSFIGNVTRRIEIRISSKNGKPDEVKDYKGEKKHTDLIGEWKPVEKHSLKALTELCKTLTEKSGEENEKESNYEIANAAKGNLRRHPFQAPLPAQFPAVPMNPAQAIQSGTILQVVNPIKTPVQSREVQLSFPVSSGMHHRAKESAVDQATSSSSMFESENKLSINISSVIAERLQIQRKLKSEPFSVDAIAKLRECDEMIKTWSKAGVRPEKFTGEKTQNILTKEELGGGFIAWAKKDFFNNLQPIRDGIGLRLLQKMGWTYGQPLGKNRAGFINPLAFEIRTDRRGLSTADEAASTLKAKRKGPPVIDVQGKHPVSALSEYCTKQKWPMPDFKLITDSGPSHHKSFMFNVVVNGGEYKPEQPSPNKKNAKAQAASAALRKLGLTS